MKKLLQGLAIATLLVAGLSSPAAANVFHVIAFRYKPNVTEAQRDQFAREILALSDRSTWDGRPLIISLRSGTPISREGFDQKFQQMFIMEFRTAADRDYFVGPPYLARAEAAHQAVIDKLVPHIEKDGDGQMTGTFVYDFETSAMAPQP